MDSRVPALDPVWVVDRVSGATDRGSPSRWPAARPPSQVALPVAVPEREFTAELLLPPPPSPSRGRALLPEDEEPPESPQLLRGWLELWLLSWRCRPEYRGRAWVPSTYP